jgi:hypothetical protein
MKRSKSRILLTLAYRKSIISRAEMDSSTTCLLFIKVQALPGDLPGWFKVVLIVVEKLDRQGGNQEMERRAIRKGC